MFSKIYSAAAVALAASTMVSAQTFTTCNPLEKTCPADKAVGNKKLSCDMTKDLCSVFTELDGTDLTYGANGAEFSIKAESNAPTVRTGKYIFFGRVDVEVQAADGQGIVTSFVLQSDDLDEIDWEWVGGDADKAQSNYFSKGDDSVFDRGAYHAAPAALTSFHTYSVEWTAESVIWLIDNKPVRTLTCADVSGSSACPETPMEIKLGTWVAGRKDAPEGTVEWAGGLTDFTKAPFNGYYRNIVITDYAGKSGPTSESVKEYVYGDKSGSWESIKVVKGDGSDDGDSSSSTTKKATSTKATSTKATSTKASTTKATSTKAHSTTESKTSTKAESTSTKSKTTKTVVSSVFTPTPSATTSKAASTTTTGAPAQKTTDAPDAAPRSTVAIGGAVLAVVAMFAQLL
jgi:beta-glucanase (GH16 family)